MKAPSGGNSRFSGVQRKLLLALLAGPMSTAEATECGLASAVLELRTARLVDWTHPTGWQLTTDGASLAEKIAAG